MCVRRSSVCSGRTTVVVRLAFQAVELKGGAVITMLWDSMSSDVRSGEVKNTRLLLLKSACSRVNGRAYCTVCTISENY